MRDDQDRRPGRSRDSAPAGADGRRGDEVVGVFRRAAGGYGFVRPLGDPAAKGQIGRAHV